MKNLGALSFEFFQPNFLDQFRCCNFVSFIVEILVFYHSLLLFIVGKLTFTLYCIFQKYVSNFETEKIGMIELPYMNEERLSKIGIPMGPRMRILQESQLCFRQENFNIYIV